ncbi:MAG: hypothetical protein COU35_02075 [Candidatus Magasanikbacteria bacterium CG10_big_fil_rev_8_21_14_0_10_47_10]|uniref:HlyC/CorC family transporter n=1 Tax=Candidatus Magasanikbacteria bacterium CG10_big_fil_rev_8_21_14_0_10_47_10 TaxID=1974652 RepID=A0A2H0TQT2_9BACT|nr:MAG: hypothetical protein COU35_02075 [Candidatus Magasanikbacteria bacterium CG10_big_fil_rev_8_21_14_0_10_47_10]
MTFQLILLFILLILSAFFSASEVAFISLSHAKVEAMTKQKIPRAKQIKLLKDNPRRLLVTILIGNNIVNIAASSLATLLATGIFESAVIGITTGIMTLLVLTFGEIIPKSYASNHPKRFAMFAAPTLRIFQLVTFPLVLLFEWMTNVFTGKHQTQRVSEEEIRSIIKTGSIQGSIEMDESMMIERLFSLNDITAELIMTPRVRMTALKHDQTIEQAADIIKNNPYTRYPVMQESIDHIIGFVHSRDVLMALHEDKENQSVGTIVHPIVVVPRQMPIDDVMKEFQKRKTHIAVVVDEFGGTEGVVTFEDVIEELVGEITDEHDVEESMIHRVDPLTIIASGDTTIRDINDFFNCELPGQPLDTLAELMLDHLQKLPRVGQTAVFGIVTAKVIEVKKKRIQRVELKKK